MNYQTMTYQQMLENERRMDRPFLPRKMYKECLYVHDEESFDDLIHKHTGSYFSREKYLYCFYHLWELIPEMALYPIYQELLSDIHILKGRIWYVDFFKPKILKVIMANNRRDTVNNPELNSLLDENGFLTVYHGTCKKTMHNAHSWCLKKEDALIMGQLRAFLFKSPDYYCVTGKVRLDDIITHFTVRGGREDVAVLQRNVREKTKEFFDCSEEDGCFITHSMWI